MMKNSLDHIAAGHAALESARWLEARGHFEAALKDQDDPEGHDGLGVSLWWLNDIRGAHEHRNRAYVAFKRRGELGRAARIAIWLAREQVFLSANHSAMHGWFARAERLLSEVGPCVEQGWFNLLRASMLATPAELEQSARESLQVARQFKDVDLEALALAFAGTACVTLGHVAEGMASLDEAMAMVASGEVTYPAVSEVFCVMLSACDLAGDLARTEHWCQTAAAFAEEHHCPFLAATCRTTYGGLLTATGRWHDAETELLEAIRSFEAGHRALRAQAVIKLADLRVYQGRLAEADALLAGYEDHSSAMLPLARLHLARGETQLAYATLHQALQPTRSPTLDDAPILRLLVDVLLAQGETEAAKRSAEQLTALAQTVQSDLLLAQADLATGQIKRQLGESDAAVHFQSAIDRLRTYEQSLLAGRVRVEMARLLNDTDRVAAIMWARAALASFERLGATHNADEATSLLRQMGAAVRPGPRSQASLTHRESEVLALIAQGLTNREIADRLVVSPKTVEHHVGQILSKIGARSRTEAASFAVRHDPTHPAK
ncbi:MAG: LuxR C-terminal-related transcriptional regulator [Anaerolineae bacterium]